MCVCVCVCVYMGIGSCKQRVSVGRSGGKTAAASHSGDSQEQEGSNRDKVGGQS